MICVQCADNGFYLIICECLVQRNAHFVVMNLFRNRVGAVVPFLVCQLFVRRYGVVDVGLDAHAV